VKRNSAYVIPVAVLAALSLAATACGATAAGLDAVQVDELAQRVLPAYVFVGGGSGAVISPDGYVITNAHVTRSSKRWKIRTPDGTYHAARVIGSSPGTDLCLLKIDHAENLPHLPLGDSDQLEVGDVVIAVGNPFALGNIDGKPTVTLGVVSALHVDRPHAYDAIQTDTPINPGNSGGPLINLKGELVGVNAQIQTRFGLRQNTGVGYAISSNQVKRFLPALKDADGKAVPSGRIAGIVLDTEPDKPAIVKDVRADSDAAKAGIQKGDVLVALDKAAIGTARDFLGALGRYPIGVEVTLRVERGDPAEEHEFRMQIVRHGRAYLGFKFDLKKPNSLTIHTVVPGGPAAKAGVKTGDRLVGIGRMRIRSRRDYYRVLYRLRPGMTIPFIIRRGNARPQALRLAVAAEDQ